MLEDGGIRQMRDGGGGARTDCIDPKMLEAVVGGDAVMARELVEDLLPSARSDIETIRRAADSLLLSEVGAVSHKLKGSVALVGARDLMALCAELQAAAKGGDKLLVGSLAVRLEGCLQEVEAALQTLLGPVAAE